METYVLCRWPEIDLFTNHSRYNECILALEERNHTEVGLGARFVPVDLYVEVTRKSDSPWGPSANEEVINQRRLVKTARFPNQGSY